MSNNPNTPAMDSGASFVKSTEVSMDPRLQRLVARRRAGTRELASASTSSDEVAVIAKVTNLDAWNSLSEVRAGAELGGSSPDGTVVVTARIPIRRIEHVRTQKFVRSLKAAQAVRPTLAATVDETGAREALLPEGHLANGGAGAVVGIVDYGCDFAHRNFRDAGGGTRILSIWDQGGPTGTASPLGYGAEFTREQINEALHAADPYTALGYGPEPDSIDGPPGTHGTHVMDIAAGNGLGSGVPGMAPNADLIFVDVSSDDVPFVGATVVGKSFGDSTRLLEAIKYIFDRAGTRPCVINVSLGTNGGPHDGSTLVEDGIDRLLREAPNRSVVIAASNSYGDGIHASGTVNPGHATDLVWQIPPGDFTQNEFEVWYEGEDRFALELEAPDGTSLGTIEPGESGTLTVDGNIVIFVANRLGDPNNADNMIGIFLERGLPGGDWIVRLHGRTVTNGAFHAWIERDDNGQSQFAPPHDDRFTIGTISCGRETLVVGSYDAHKVGKPLSFFTSAGPTRDGREKPEISAPGHQVLAAHSRTSTGVVRKSGTSMAAPATTGLVALVLAEALARNLSLSIDQIRGIVTSTARKNPPPGGGWDDRYGAGRISATAAVAAVMSLAPGVHSSVTAPISAVHSRKPVLPSKPERPRTPSPVRR